MSHLSYLAVLAACLVCVTPLAVAVRHRMQGQSRRLGLTLLVTFVIFSGWDLYAIRAHQWQYAPTRTVGLSLPGRLLVEEALFFLVIPLCIVLTFETVHRVLPALRPAASEASEASEAL